MDHTTFFPIPAPTRYSTDRQLKARCEHPGAAASRHGQAGYGDCRRTLLGIGRYQHHSPRVDAAAAHKLLRDSETAFAVEINAMTITSERSSPPRATVCSPVQATATILMPSLTPAPSSTIKQRHLRRIRVGPAGSVWSRRRYRRVVARAACPRADRRDFLSSPW